MFAVDTMAELETATLAVVDGEDFVPGYNRSIAKVQPCARWV
jgi:hypothetical protein